MIWLLALAGVVATISWSPFRWNRSAPRRARRLDDYARRVNLAVDPRANALLMQRLVSRDRAMLLGGLCGTVIVVAGYVLAGSPERADIFPLGVFIGVLVGGVLADWFSTVGYTATLLLALLVMVFLLLTERQFWRRLWAPRAAADPVP